MRHSLRLALILFTSLFSATALSQSGQSGAFLWTAGGGMQDLGVLSGWQSSAGLGINQTGVVVGQLFKVNGGTDLQTAFGWSNSFGMRYLKGLSLTNSIAGAVNDRGQVVGSSITANGQVHAFLWTREGGAQDLGTLGRGDERCVGHQQLRASRRQFADSYRYQPCISLDPGRRNAGPF
jgi:probable HAF family extracellular repeat protein